MRSLVGQRAGMSPEPLHPFGSSIKHGSERVDIRAVRRPVLIFVALLSLAAIAAVAYARGRVPGTDGCVLRSVDRGEYVAANEAVFRAIPVPSYLRKAYSTTWTHAIPAHNQCLPTENGPPYGAYLTTRVYVGERLGFDDSVLHGKWARGEAGDVHTLLFRRGDASLTVTTTAEGVLLTVDSQGYAGRSH